MAKFQGNLRDSKGNALQQTMTAASLKVARDTWKQKGFVVQEIKEVKGGFSFAALTMKKVAVKDLALFSRQLATLVNAGVSMVRGLGVMVDQCSNPTLKIALTEVLDDVQQGTNFSDGLRKHPKVFDKLFCAMIQAGETGGVLDDVLSRMATLLEDSARLNNQIKSAMTYPIVVCSIALIIFLAMCIFIIPTFDGVFKSLGGELPAFTQILVNISNFLKSEKIFILPATFFGLSFAYKRAYATPAGHLYFDGLFLKISLIYMQLLHEHSSCLIISLIFSNYI